MGIVFIIYHACFPSNNCCDILQGMRNRDLKPKIKALKRYFETEPAVILAYVFGSFAKGLQTEESDFDIAIYLTEKGDKGGIWSKITKITEKEVDLVCLNEAPASLISNILKTGTPLVLKDKKLYWDLYLKASSEAEDFLRFAKDYLRIFRKAKSLSIEEKTRLLERIQFLESELKELKEFKKLSFAEYQEDKTKQRNTERWVENIINASIDIAKIILASEKKRMPRTYAEALLNFGSFAGLTEEEARKLSEFASLRNILAHEYLDILYDEIRNFIKNSPQLYQKILKFLSTYTA